MKRFLIFLLFLFSIAILYSQEASAAPEDSLQAEQAAETSVQDSAVVEEVELTEEEILCKQAADDFMQIYEKWDVSRDYEILLPRVKAYVSDFYESGTDPDESNRKDLSRLKELYENLL